MTRADPNLQVALTMQPSHPRQMDPTHLLVTLTNSQGQPVTGAEVGVDFLMPTMAMPPQHVPLVAQSPGHYAAMGRFSMPGQWRVIVTAARARHQAVQSFSVSVQ